MNKMKLPLKVVLIILSVLIIFFIGASYGANNPNGEYVLLVAGISVIIGAIGFGWWGRKNE